VREQRESDRNDQERDCKQERGQAVSVAERCCGQMPRLLDQRIGIEIRAAL
jgi:hypothetical protein